MPVRKFRTLDEAERSLWLEPGDPRIWEAHVCRWALHRFFTRETAPARTPGVYKYRSVEEKQRPRNRS
jgi:hypothetical protein